MKSRTWNLDEHVKFRPKCFECDDDYDDDDDNNRNCDWNNYLIKRTGQALLIYLSTAIGLSPGGSSTVHIYTQTINRTTQTIHRTTQQSGTVRAVSRLG